MAALSAAENHLWVKTPANKVAGVARDHSSRTSEGEAGDMPVNDVGLPGVRSQRPHPSSRRGVERPLVDGIACEELRQTRLSRPSSPDLGHNRRTGPQCHLTGHGEFNECPDPLIVALPGQKRPGVKDRLRAHAVSTGPTPSLLATHLTVSGE